MIVKFIGCQHFEDEWKKRYSMASENKKSKTKTSSGKAGAKSTKGSKASGRSGSAARPKASGRSGSAARSKNSGRSGSSARSKAAMERKAREAEAARQKQLRSEVILIVLFAFSLFLLLANFRICGIVGNTISGFFFGIIGFSEYVFPVYLFVSAAYLISNDFNRKIAKKVIYFGVVMILVSMLFQAIYSTDYESVKALYMDGYKNRAGGGVICGGIFFAVRTLLGVPGACIIMFILAVIMFILITEISVIDELKKIALSFKKDYSYEDEDEEYALRETAVADRRQPGHKRRLRNETEEAGNVDDERRAKPSMANLNVYESKKSSADRQLHGGRKAPKEDISSTQVNDVPRDFFYNQDVHELKADDSDNYSEQGSYDEFNNDIEKIVMADSDEFLNPVQVEDETMSESHYIEPVKSETREEKPVHKGYRMNSDNEVKPVIDGQFVNAMPAANEISAESDEDVLAGAVNGNMHPESVSDYNPLYDSAFAEQSSGQKTSGGSSTVKKSVIDNNSAKTYQEGRKYRFPTASLLSQPPKHNNSNRDAHVRETAVKLKKTLETFGVNVTITNYSCGPAVTRFEMQPEQGVKVSKILNLADDIKLNLAAADIRIEAPIPGKAAIGIEVPNKENSIVAFRELIESDNFKNLKSKVAFAVGKDISGQVIATDIAKMPHLLIAGATGSGKSVCINTLIMSILYKATPEEVKLIMIDPKMVELACYNGIPHLLIPVVTDPKKAAGALNWAVVEMTRRYQLFAEHSVRNIQGYNDKVESAVIAGADGQKLTKMPQIVVIVDELADLMMVAHGEVEDAIVRLSQLARAAGIHLVIATQRPSVDVITGLIKANVPSRIAFAVSSGVDSRTILDMVGAEKLLGKGDMLFYPTGYPKPVRVQGAFVSDDEVTAVVDFLKKSNGVGTYDDDVAKSISSTDSGGATAIGGTSANDRDEYFVEAGRFIIEKEKASIGMLQRTFKIGFNRAARIMDQLMAAGVVGPEEGTKARKILMSQEQFDEYIDNNL